VAPIVRYTPPEVKPTPGSDLNIAIKLDIFLPRPRLLDMARPIRIEYEAAVYHVTMRGNDRRIVFGDDFDRQRFLAKLAESVTLFEIRLHLYCLMTNHVHLVFGTPRANLSRFMQRLETAYTVTFNHRHKRCGHLFQGRFGSVLVDQDAHMLKLSRYVHLNPVFTKAARELSLKERVAILRTYPWSSYRSYIGRVEPESFVDYGPVLEMVGSKGSSRKGAYRRFVESGIEDIDAAFIETKRASRLCLGSEGFRDRVEALYQQALEGRTDPEDVSFRRGGRTASVERITSLVCQEFGVDKDRILSRRRDSLVRPVLARLLCQMGGLTQRATAEILGLRSGAAVSVQLRRLDAALSRDRRLAKRVAVIESRLRKDQGKV